VSALIGGAGLAGSGAGGRAASPEIYPAALLEQALQPLLDGERRVVLDLGEPHEETVAFFSGLPVRLTIASVVSELMGLETPAEPDDLQRSIDTLLPADLVAGAQVVLVWDALNYLPPAVIKALTSRLARLLSPGALLHGFVAYSAKVIPALPRALVIRSEGGLRELPSNNRTTTREAPGYGTGELQRLMPDFRVIKATLLRDGMQEFLCRI
jgi:hypothetical protein